MLKLLGIKLHASIDNKKLQYIRRKYLILVSKPFLFP